MNSFKKYRLNEKYLELKKVTDTQLEITSSNERIDLFNDPLYFVLPSPRIRELILKRAISESDYWNYFFNAKSFICSRCGRPFPVDERDLDSCECDHKHSSHSRSKYIGYSEDDYDGSNYWQTKIDLDT